MAFVHKSEEGKVKTSLSLSKKSKLERKNQKKEQRKLLKAAGPAASRALPPIVFTILQVYQGQTTADDMTNTRYTELLRKKVTRKLLFCVIYYLLVNFLCSF